MKKTILSVAALAFAGTMMAQENRFSLGLEVGLPMGDWGDAQGLGLGGSLGFEAPMGDNLGLLAQAGYISFAGKDITVLGITVEGNSVGMIPIQVGAKYYFSDNQAGAYFGLLAGVHMSMVTVTNTEINLTTGTTTTSEETETQTNFSFAPMFGYFVTENIDIGMRYQLVSGKEAEVNTTTFAVEEKTVMNSYLGFRIAYMFGQP